MTPEQYENADSECVKCGRAMFRRNHYTAPKGVLLHQAHGLCVTCYQSRRRAAVTGHTLGGRPSDREVDPIEVARIVAGYGLPSNAAVRAAVVAELTRRGESSAEIARRLSVAERSVVRIRAQLRKAA